MAPFKLKNLLIRRKNAVGSPGDARDAARQSSPRQTEPTATPSIAQAENGLIPQTPPLDQNLSPLFTKLPLELREQIYGALFGCGVCHVVAWQAGHLLGNIRCSGNVFEDAFRIDNPCWGHFWAAGDRQEKSTQFLGLSDGAYRTLSLILSCRKIYTEAIELLYSKTRFFFTGPDIINIFASKVPGQFRQRISFIELTAPSIYAITYPSPMNGTENVDHYHQWKQCVFRLSQMPGLNKLYVVVPNSKPYDQWRHTVDDERKLLESLVQLRHVREVVVALAWYGGNEDFANRKDQETEKYPFQLFRFDGQQHLPKEELAP